jgi:hypothetical protein
LDDDHAIRVLHRRETVGDHQLRAVLHQLAQRLLHQELALGVEVGRRLVQDQNRRVLEEGAATLYGDMAGGFAVITSTAASRRFSRWTPSPPTSAPSDAGGTGTSPGAQVTLAPSGDGLPVCGPVAVTYGCSGTHRIPAEKRWRNYSRNYT